MQRVRKKIMVVFGTRPEAIKMIPVILKLNENYDRYETVVCNTGQHRDMVRQILDEFSIREDFNLDVMKHDQNLFDVTTAELQGLRQIMTSEKPDLVLVQGDTTSTFTASLTAYYLKIKTGHIEAGLRTNDKFSPFPEEQNRRMTDCLTDIFFTPTPKARENLIKEGFNRDRIFVTGNTSIDTLYLARRKQENHSSRRAMESRMLEWGITFNGERNLLVTLHRRESFGRDIRGICHALKRTAQEYSGLRIILPVHPNPNVQKPIQNILSSHENIRLIPPQDYFSFVFLMSRAHIILTDSGGIQEEAPSLGKPVLVARNKTERPEGIRAGNARLIGIDCDRIYKEITRLLHNDRAYKKMAHIRNPYGDGSASRRILEIIDNQL